MNLGAGARLGPYEVVAPLGAGGMGEVYRARDTRLGREVAIKVLPEALARDRDRLARFEQEARLASALNHPSIVTVHDVGAEGGTSYIAMELVSGRTLRELLDDGPLPVRRVLGIATQVADGLAKAHAAGIVHRDLKPENVMVTTDGLAKVLDFGLGKAVAPEQPDGGAATTASHVTEPGTVLGTVAYMSPEQALGRPADFRSDQFSFGSVLYEMVTGTRAFARPSAPETMTAVIREDPAPLERAAPGTPVPLRWILERCLEKDPEQRYGSTRDLARDLARLRDALPDTASSARHGAAPSAAEPRALPSVAVLPFVNMSADPENEFFADGITEDVIAHLAKIRTLRVTSRTSVMAFKRRQQSLREIGAALGVAAIVEGSVRRFGNRVRIVAQLVDPGTDEHLWAESYDRELDDIFAIQTDVALQIAAALRAELTVEERARIGVRPTRDLEAYQLYLQGRHHLLRFTREGLTEGLACFERAVARDPSFALAYTAMAHAHTQFGIEGMSGVQPLEAFERAQAAVQSALALDDGLAEAHGILGLLRFARDFDWKGAEAELRLALALSPGSADAYDHLGWLCSAQCRFDESLALVRRARELDPMAHRSDVANELMRAGRAAEALAEAERAIALDPDYSRSRAVFGWACLAVGRAADGLAALERAVELAPGSTLFLAQLGQACGVTGDVVRARGILADLERLAASRFVAAYHLAHVHTGLGDHEAAVDCLERAYELRSGGIYGVKGSYLFAPLRPHPRFQALLRRMNL
ncbi:MAG TPA: protein kinase [Thermoanaerobaculaceae bacterium]|nr:protein kinase [Thermoanaerobaculaceae bacterium]